MASRTTRGFTLLELMVVLVILALLGTVAAPRITKHLRDAKVQTAKIQVDALSAAVESFHIDLGRLPSNDEGLSVLVERPSSAEHWDGPYLKKRESLIDPWGVPFKYRVPGQFNDFDVYSFGSDKREGGEKEASDVGNW